MTRDDDAGTAIIEFVFVAILVMVPLIYLIVAFASVQRSELAVTQAAREAGRAFATADTAAEAQPRAAAAVRLALQSHGIRGAEVRYVPAAASCTGTATVTPQLRAGAQFRVCVLRTAEMPGVPHFLAGHGIRTVGAYVVHVDDYRVTS